MRIQLLFSLILIIGVSRFAFANEWDGESPPVITQALTKIFPRLLPAFDELQRGDLLVLDLDNTVFRESSQLGTDEWYTHVLQELTAKGMSKREASEHLEPLNMQIKTNSKMRLMEEGLPELIRGLQQRGVFVIGLTARHPNLAPSTLRHLQELNIDFSHSNFPHQPLIGFRLPELHNDFLWQDGVAFTDGSPKGMVLKALITRTAVEPQRVMALDDRIHHVHSFVEALLELRLEGRVIHYLRALEEPFDARIAESQLSHFLATGIILADHEVLPDSRVDRCEEILTKRI